MKNTSAHEKKDKNQSAKANEKMFNTKHSKIQTSPKTKAKRIVKKDMTMLMKMNMHKQTKQSAVANLEHKASMLPQAKDQSIGIGIGVDMITKLVQRLNILDSQEMFAIFEKMRTAVLINSLLKKKTNLQEKLYLNCGKDVSFIDGVLFCFVLAVIDCAIMQLYDNLRL
ncbi:hypothetical protein RFI_27501 [Reticulomyxa filosa]|uniref:Uncharacterized protein n=1 Tax=Reticulomyxa filosa TaxID=46433 RepID=X6MA51_RETFI|nr:hypothetical protein RFI_27501 [Reticulomyxa filosa]|eukprot:ETO09875.1 hypothetical protein RFI_27501 [Reticulomyxa filosa]